MFGAGLYPGKISKHRRSDRNLEKSKISKKPFRSPHCAKFAPKFFMISFYTRENSNMVKQNRIFRRKCPFIFKNKDLITCFFVAACACFLRCFNLNGILISIGFSKNLQLCVIREENLKRKCVKIKYETVEPPFSHTYANCHTLFGLTKM